MKKLAVLAVIAGLTAGIMTGCGGTQRNADAAAQMTGRGNGAQQTAVQSGEVYDDRDDRFDDQYDDRNEAANTDQAAALQTALKDAGVNEADASRIRVTMDRDDGMLVYEVRFDAAEVEYDYEIDAESGRIISTDVERWDDDDRDDRNQTANANVAVSRDEAVKTALGKVSGATEKDVRIELDYDDGRYRYEGDIIYNGIEYDFEIDADSGRILEWEEDRR
ncbi:MAG TPA: PepSY domain-containing protein [Candidatus Mediterraneibacter guildfordensis]|nr:PepSY domain-containing protein [Candidatus Mediterraneibacter guildfordensis]